MKAESSEKLRIDKWCWMTRFYKTRRLAVDAISKGNVFVNDQKTKPAYSVKLNDIIKISKDQIDWVVKVVQIPKRRGPAKEAQTMYEETASGLDNRLVLEAQNRADRITRPREDVKPDKHQRKQLRHLKFKD